MDKYQSQHSVVHVGSNLLRPRGGWYPVRSSYATEDGLVQRAQDGLDIRLEQAVINLTEYIADCFGFFGQLHKE